jgi:hypothetical protein
MIGYFLFLIGQTEILTMIRESRRADFAGQVLAAIGYEKNGAGDFAVHSWKLANAVLAEWEKEVGK